MKPKGQRNILLWRQVVPYIGTWIETHVGAKIYVTVVVPYIGTWIETGITGIKTRWWGVVPYIGTWIETPINKSRFWIGEVVPYIGTWIETLNTLQSYQE